MAKRRDYTKEYRKARELFMRRRREWMKTKHWYVEAPEIPKSPTLKDIQRLEKTRIENLTKRQVKQYEKQFDIAYDEGKIDLINKTYERFIQPLSEAEYNQVTQLYEDSQVTFETEPAESEAEIIADLQSLIEGMIEQGQTAARSHAFSSLRGEAFRQIFWDAVNQVNDKKAYLRYLEDSSTHSRLTEVVTRGVVDSDPKGRQFEDAKTEFATILNLGRPLTVDQSETLTMSDAIDFDFSETDYE